jgi:2-hydroxy-3-keto-5-methylthiopentenyl-1-phosphate phosphatase
MHDGFKESYSRHFLRQGYRLIYVGNGASDVMPAQYADKIFARDTLLASCKEKQIECQPFDDLSGVARTLEHM